MGSRAQAQWCDAQALLLRGMWDLPGPGLQPVSPALAGGFLTTVPPGKPHAEYFNQCEKQRLESRVGEEPLKFFRIPEIHVLERWHTLSHCVCLLFPPQGCNAMSVARKV